MCDEVVISLIARRLVRCFLMAACADGSPAARSRGVGLPARGLRSAFRGARLPALVSRLS